MFSKRKTVEMKLVDEIIFKFSKLVLSSLLENSEDRGLKSGYEIFLSNPRIPMMHFNSFFQLILTNKTYVTESKTGQVFSLYFLYLLLFFCFSLPRVKFLFDR